MRYRYSCHNCGAEFSTRDKLDAHVADIGDPLHGCTPSPEHIALCNAQNAEDQMGCYDERNFHD